MFLGVPILLGRVWTIAMVYILSLLCFREFSRVTGLFRERFVSALVVIASSFIHFAALDHWYGFFIALGPISVTSIALLAVTEDRPEGYIQRVALALFGTMLFAHGLGHLAFMANDPNYQSVILMLFVLVALSDVGAYVCGKSFGKVKLAPKTSPNKTQAGFFGALVITAILTVILGQIVFAGTRLDSLGLLLLLGLLISLVGQLGDLTLSSIKRDIGIKDFGKAIPGHGGFLDRFDSMTLVAPLAFHYIGYYIGFGIYEPVRIYSSSF